jgi:hypothetical protein
MRRRKIKRKRREIREKIYQAKRHCIGEWTKEPKQIQEEVKNLYRGCDVAREFSRFENARNLSSPLLLYIPFWY